jgi:outer membrane lipoprotein SlyB
MKEVVTKVTSNPIGLLVGAGAGYLIASKVIKSDKMWITVVSAVVGGVVGATIQSRMKAKASQPTKETIVVKK